MPPWRSRVSLCGPPPTWVALPRTFVARLAPVWLRALVPTSPGELLFLSSGSGDRRTLSRMPWVTEYWYQSTHLARHVEQPAKSITAYTKLLAFEIFPSSNTQLLHPTLSRTRRLGYPINLSPPTLETRVRHTLGRHLYGRKFLCMCKLSNGKHYRKYVGTLQWWNKLRLQIPMTHPRANSRWGIISLTGAVCSLRSWQPLNHRKCFHEPTTGQYPNTDETSPHLSTIFPLTPI
jgi:hypothetical protein